MYCTWPPAAAAALISTTSTVSILMPLTTKTIDIQARITYEEIMLISSLCIDTAGMPPAVNTAAYDGKNAAWMGLQDHAKREAAHLPGKHSRHSRISSI